MQIFLVVFGVVLTVFGIGLSMERNAPESDGPSKFSFLKIVEFESRGPGIAVLFVGTLFVLFGVFLPQLQGVIGQRDAGNVPPSEAKASSPKKGAEPPEQKDDAINVPPAIPKSTRNNPTAEILKDTKRVDNTDVEKKPTGEITLQYLGDVAACSLDLRVRVADKTFRPTSNVYDVSGIRLGAAKYSISGAIGCPLIGTCTASGSGDIDVEDGAAYNVVWQNVGIRVCRVALVNSP